VEYRVRRFPDRPMGDHGLHACLARAGVLAPGTTSERMQCTRHGIRPVSVSSTPPGT
jgi:hypothetical protein